MQLLEIIQINRIRMLLISPRQYWSEQIDGPTDLRALLVPRMLLLAALPAGAWILGRILSAPLLSHGILGSLRVVLMAIANGVLWFGLNVAVFVGLGLVIEQLAAVFDARRDRARSFGLAEGAIIPMWAGSLLNVIPWMGVGALGTLLGLAYGGYALYLGLPVMLGLPEQKRLTFVVTILAVLLVASMLLTGGMSHALGCMTYRR